MKAAQEHMVLYLLCLASVVWAAPTHSTLFHFRTVKRSETLNSRCKSQVQPQARERGSLLLLEGSTRRMRW